MYRPNAAFDSATRTDHGDYTWKSDDRAPNDKGGTGVLPLLKWLDLAPKLLARLRRNVGGGRHEQPGGRQLSAPLTADG
jgi:hypothetical protein